MLRICNRNLSGLTDRTGRTVRYTHDTLDHLTQVTEGPEHVLLNLRYAYDGNCTEKSGEPYQNTYTYDRMNRLAGSIQDGKGVRHAYDPAGNRLKKETGQETETYHYNAKNQLIERHTREGVIR